MYMVISGLNMDYHAIMNPVIETALAEMPCLKDQHGQFRPNTSENKGHKNLKYLFLCMDVLATRAIDTLRRLKSNAALLQCDIRNHNSEKEDCCKRRPRNTEI